MASSALISPALRSRNTAYNSSSCNCSRWRSHRKEAEKARSGSAAATNHCNTVLGATSKTRAVARIPNPSAKHAKTRTMSSTAACLPWRRVPWVSRK
jgi:hypothetical protein